MSEPISDRDKWLANWERLRKFAANRNTPDDAELPIPAGLVEFIDGELRQVSREASVLNVKAIDREQWLRAIKETLRPWWTDERSNWDGSLCGLPTEVMTVAAKIRETEKHRDLLWNALESFVSDFESDFVSNGVVVDDPDGRWGCLTRLYWKGRLTLDQVEGSDE